jgi:hypothetical protein
MFKKLKRVNLPYMERKEEMKGEGVRVTVIRVILQRK